MLSRRGRGSTRRLDIPGLFDRWGGVAGGGASVLRCRCARHRRRVDRTTRSRPSGRESLWYRLFTLRRDELDFLLFVVWDLGPYYARSAAIWGYFVLACTCRQSDLASGVDGSLALRHGASALCPEAPLHTVPSHVQDTLRHNGLSPVQADGECLTALITAAHYGPSEEAELPMTV